MKRSKEVEREEIKRIVARRNTLKALLNYYGLALHAFDPGVVCSDGRGTLEFNGPEWSFLEPLLCELKAYREGSTP